VNPPVTLTLWRTFSRGRRGVYTWREFVDIVRAPEVVRDKKKVAGFSLAAFDENRRALSRVEKVYALTLDFDHGDTTIKQAARLLPGTCGVAYTTFSHSPAHPKLRVVYLLDRPIDAIEYEHLWYWASRAITKLGHVLDESARDASRFWYLPSHPPGTPYEWRELEGRPLDVGAALKDVSLSLRPFPGGMSSRVLTASTRTPGNGRVCDDSADQSFFGRAFTHAGLAFELMDNGALSVVCPWAHTHTSGADGDSSTVILPPTTESGWGCFHCSHAHCTKRATLDLLEVLEPGPLAAARREHGGGLVRTSVRAGFVQHLAAFDEFVALDRFVLRCYPLGGGAPLVWTVKLGSRAHTEGLEALPLRALRGRKADLAVREGPRGGQAITWGRIVPEVVVA